MNTFSKKVTAVVVASLLSACGGGGGGGKDGAAPNASPPPASATVATFNNTVRSMATGGVTDAAAPMEINEQNLVVDDSESAFADVFP